MSNYNQNKENIPTKLFWLVLLTGTTGFDADDTEYTNTIGSFELYEDAEEFTNNYHMGPYDIRIVISRGRIK